MAEGHADQLQVQGSGFTVQRLRPTITVHSLDHHPGPMRNFFGEMNYEIWWRLTQLKIGGLLFFF